MKKFVIFVTILCSFTLLVISGCATVPAATPTVSSPLTSRVNQASLQQLQNWQLQAEIAVRASQKSFTASLAWQQQAKSYSLYLFGPLGLDGIKINSDGYQVTLQTSNNQVYTANSAEQLLWQQTGWQLPISNLYYWIRGIPAPTGKWNYTWNLQKQCEELQQQGWIIDYVNILEKDSLTLPQRIYMTNKSLQVRIFISNWQI